MINPFAGNGFSLITMTNVVNDLKFLPGRIGELGLFEPQAVTTTEIAVERKGDTLMLVPPTPRGGVGVTQDRVRRELRSLTVPHFEIADSVAADEVQGVRAFGSEAPPTRSWRKSLSGCRTPSATLL